MSRRETNFLYSQFRLRGGQLAYSKLELGQPRHLTAKTIVTTLKKGPKIHKLTFICLAQLYIENYSCKNEKTNSKMRRKEKEGRINIIRTDCRLNRTRNMWLHKIPMCRFLLLRFLIVGLTFSRTLKASEEIRETKVIFEETSSTTNQSVHETTTAIVSLLRPVIDSSNRELTSPTEARSRNDSNVFKPSKHLGEIEEPVVRTNPFNNVQPVRFDNNVHLDARHERFQNILQDASQGITSLLDEVTRSSRIKFQDDGVVQTSNIQYVVHRPFPWKKIITLIGTFLPLGLLLATLKPNVIRIDNTTTQPSIVLSKLRSVDLPVEHKQARILDDQSIGCEDQSICELILAGGEPESNILQNILWNLATRTPDDVVKRNGQLREVFSAVKKKDCTAISC
ncbi:hypothetical protein DBV15_10230 [Temnothorax longispinosus]|uniref:Uncharacterized protein n=1 Tax=Temnothorax longispinosus TaxID=300112 RepID=A0A4S2KFE8_9HYME|nr:hypothetical protein DBV15_10230 [Temnothorax longispinosus]